MKAKKAFKFRIYPNKAQTELINKTIGCSRFVANFVLAQQSKEEKMWAVTQQLVQQGMLSENNYKSTFFNKGQSIKTIPQLKQNYEWLKEVDSIALQAAVENVADAYSRYYKKQNGKPKFKSKKNPVQAYTTKCTNGNIKVIGKHIQLPKLGLVKFAKSKEVNGEIKRATISRRASGKYFISILAEVEVKEFPKTNSSIGLDVGLSKFVTLSNGLQHDNPKFFRKLEQNLAKAQCVLARRQQGSFNWHKQRIKVARLHERIVNARTDYLHKISTDIVKNHDIIGIEDLKVSTMQKLKEYAKAISEVSWYQFRTMLEYKAKWYGKQVVLVKPEYTSQTCSRCGYISKKNRVSQAKFVCKKCGHQDNADINAAKNIEVLALAQLTTIASC